MSASMPLTAASDRVATRRRLRAALGALLALAAPLVATPAMAADWVARHGLTGAQYQAAFEDYAGKGFRLASISGYDSGGSARYAALWVKKPGPEWSARHGLNAQQYQAAFDDYAKKGYRLTFVNGYAVGGNAYYAGIWTKSGGPAWSARHGLTSAQYQDAVEDLSKQGYGLSHVSAYTVGGTPRFAAIFEKGGPAWVARHGLTSAQYQTAFEGYAREGYRLKVVSGYREGNGDRYAALWVKTGGPQWSARHGIPAAHYQSVFDNYRYQSWEPTYIEAFNGGNGVRFNGVWQNSTFRPQDLALIESKARAYMRANDVPGLSIAIMRNEKLVYAAGFGVADKDSSEPVGPMHRFRIASVSKPFTHIAVLKLIADTNLDSGSKVFGNGSVLGGQYPTPDNNPKIEDITVDHLIRHRAGFVNVDKDGASSDPMFAYTGTTHKGLIEWALANYPLGYDPGTVDYNPDNDPKTNDMYSNFGYSVLGRVIEAKTGKSYEAYVRDAIFKPAGAGDIVIGGDKAADRKPGEVVYYGGGAYSSVKPVRFDSHGGWIARPMDLLRVMKYESVLGTPYAHYGEMSGTMSIYRRTSDGFGLAATANSNNDSTGDMNAMMTDIAKGVPNWPDIDLF
ncbi:MAG: serine hydrolase [Pseudomonadota bacterium]